MHRQWRPFVLAAIGMLVSTGAAVVPADAGHAVALRSTVPSVTDRTVTLITGDRVTVTGGVVSVRPGPGRADIPMLTSTVGGHTRVVPGDALPLLHADQVDARLFDVTELIAAGYDDRRSDLPLIAGVSTGMSGVGVRRLASVKATALRTPKRDLGRLWSARVKASRSKAAKAAGGKVWLDAVGRFAGAEGIQQIGAPQAWKGGLTGAGVTVGVIDSGVDVTHPDLAGRVAAQLDFTPVATGGQPTAENVHDNFGHGTFVSSIVGGAGAASEGRYRGVAPGVRLVSAKVGDFEYTESAVIQAMEWMARVQHAKVVNLSLGVADSPGLDPIESAINQLTAEQGTLFVAAAGNEGANAENPAEVRINSPGSAAAALSVGAVDHDDQPADFSSRGPAADDNTIKPDITAPGVDITGALSKDAGGGADHRYDTGWGTSYAAPHVAGSAAILAQRHPDWTPDMLKSALMGSARPAAGVSPFIQGAGRVDIPDALRTTLLADPPSLSMGTHTYPHDNNVPITKTVTYRNVTDQPISLTLHLQQTGQLLSLNTTSLTVPAGGTAQARVTAAASTNAPDGPYTGRLIAVMGSREVATPVALIREAQTYELALKHINRAGYETSNFDTHVIGLDNPYHYDSGISVPPGGLRIRVPRGRYAIVSNLLEWPDGAEAPTGTTMVAQPSVAVTASTTVTLDSRAGQPVTFNAPEPGAVRAASALDAAVRTPLGWSTYGVALSGRLQPFTLQVGADVAAGDFVSVLRTTQTAGAASYQLAWTHPGTLPTGPVEQARTDELATDKATVDQQLRGSVMQLNAGPSIPGVAGPLPAIGTSPTGIRRFSTGGGLSWASQVVEWKSPDDWDPSAVVTGSPERYEPGRTYTSVWNSPVIAPCLTPHDHVTWTGNRLSVRVPTACDSAGHGGTAASTTGVTTLFRDDRELALSETPGHATFRVEPERGDYRLRVTADRPAPFETSTRTTVDWVFTGPSAVSELQSVRMVPQPGAVRLITEADATGVTLAVSYDDGATWQPVTVGRTASGTYLGKVTPPAGAAFISLRAGARSSHSSVTQTVIRAYPLTK